MVTTTGPGTPDTTDVESMPTLVIHCDRDRAVPPEEGRLLAAEIPGARYVSLPSANHLMLEQEPAWSLFLEELGLFLNW
jgi:pimeloyl-ACP methyl ester carboxylesterase